MRLRIAGMVAALAAACAQSPAPAPSRPSPVPSVRINPSNIKRIGREMPGGYEVTSVADVASPGTIWGLGTGGTAEPAQCAMLAEPAAGHGRPAQGVSGSGAGGIIYAVVAEFPADRLDPAVIASCPRWTMTNGRRRAAVRLIDPPRVDGVQTVGMASDTTTYVEGGTGIDSDAHTFTAYLGDYYAFTTLITDPGSTHPPLAPQFAADLLAKTVSALRG